VHPQVERVAAKVLRFGIVPRAKARAGQVSMRVRARRGVSAPEIRGVDAASTGPVVDGAPFLTARQSSRHLDWRFAQYPLLREFSGLYGDHDGEAVLDLGCGAGDDVTGFATRSRARRIVGADISPSALQLARHRLSLHGVGPDRVELVRLPDADAALPFADASFDFVSSQGAIHDARDPLAVLRELHRVLRPGGEGSIMVPNRDSVFMHLVVAWEMQIRDGRFAEPVRCYAGGEFMALLEEAGFEARYLGGYLNQDELRAMQQSWGEAIVDERLADAHRRFLRELRYDYNHRPMMGDLHAGFGGSFRIRRPA